MITPIVLRGNTYNTKAEKVNTLLKEFCENNGIDTISHDDINMKKHLNKEKVHLNDNCITFFKKNSIHSMQGWTATMRHELQEKEAQKG